MNVNKTIISGRLVKDPELKKIGENDLCNFRIASNRKVGKNKTEKSVFIDVDAWGGQAAICSKFLKKGSRVIVDGTLCQDVWEGKNGEKNSKIYIESDNVVFLDSAEQDTHEAPASKETKSAPAAKKSAPSKPLDDEEIPF